MTIRVGSRGILAYGLGMPRLARPSPAPGSAPAARRRRRRRSRWLLLGLLLPLPLACKGRASAPAPEASVTTAATMPAGFRRHLVEGWSLALPEHLEARPPRSHEGNMHWLLYAAAPQSPGEPTFLFARYARPAEFPSQAFGLTTLERLARDPERKVLASRQHALDGLTVTDLEILAKERAQPRHQWRRVFVHEGFAYLLSVTVAEAEAERLRPAVVEILDSLRRE